MTDIPIETLNDEAKRLFEEIQQQEFPAGEAGVIPHLQAQLKLRLLHALMTEHRLSCLMSEVSEASRLISATTDELISSVA